MTPLEQPASKGRKEQYRQEYEASKEGGERFFPETVVRDAVVAAVIVAAIVALAILLPATSEAPADPTSTTYNPLPEWYFLFFFQFLKLFPGWLEALAGAVIPLLALALLALVPFLDELRERRGISRRITVGFGIAAILGFAFLEGTGLASAPARPAGQEEPIIQAGRALYREVNCSYCHSINGIGGSIGPDLGTVASRMDRTQIAAYLKNPHAMIPKTLHPKLQFTESELSRLVAYLETLGATVPFSPDAVALYEKECSLCHAIAGKGGTLGPDLSHVGSVRTPVYLDAFIADPRTALPRTTMPGYRDKLTPEQIRDLAGYLYSLK